MRFVGEPPSGDAGIGRAGRRTDELAACRRRPAGAPPPEPPAISQELVGGAAPDDDAPAKMPRRLARFELAGRVGLAARTVGSDGGARLCADGGRTTGESGRSLADGPAAAEVVAVALRTAPPEANSTLTVVAVEAVAAASFGAALEGWRRPLSAAPLPLPPPGAPPGDSLPEPIVDESSSEFSTGGVMKNLEMGAEIQPPSPEVLRGLSAGRVASSSSSASTRSRSLAALVGSRTISLTVRRRVESSVKTSLKSLTRARKSCEDDRGSPSVDEQE
jgi:hypothetical protein